MENKKVAEVKTELSKMLFAQQRVKEDKNSSLKSLKKGLENGKINHLTID